jgi:hypothetical protein
MDAVAHRAGAAVACRAASSAGALMGDVDYRSRSPIGRRPGVSTAAHTGRAIPSRLMAVFCT